MHRHAVRTDRNEGLHREPPEALRDMPPELFRREIVERSTFEGRVGRALDDREPRPSREPDRRHPSGPDSVPSGRRPRPAG